MPPVVGVMEVVEPIHILLSPNPVILGVGFTVTSSTSVAIHPFVISIKVNSATPALFPKTKPVLLTVATRLLLLNQTPPDAGNKFVVPSIQISSGPDILTVGEEITVTGVDNVETQPAVDVKVKVALPPDTPVTIPILLTVATSVSLLTQVPPLLGTK